MLVRAAEIGAVESLDAGMVCRKSVGHYWVTVGERTLVCSLSNKLRKELIYPIADPTSLRRRVMEVADIRAVDPVAIGDLVRFVDAEDGTGMITEVLPRRNKLVRRAAGPKPLEQVIVANVDQVVAIMAAAEPAPKWERLDRYLVAAGSLDLPVLICVTKMDLDPADDVADAVAAYRAAGYNVLLTSATTGLGMDAMREALAERLSVLIGASGAGKTTLLNTLQPGLGLRVAEVSKQTGKGRHTTTHLEMFALEWGGGVVDTPGMREFGLWDVGDRHLDALFPEFGPYLGKCQFGAGCVHEHEPGCAIKEALAAGQISERRYHSYLYLRRKG